MSNKSSLVPFLTGDDDQNLHVKMVKNSGKPGLNCTEYFTMYKKHNNIMIDNIHSGESISS